MDYFPFWTWVLIFSLLSYFGFDLDFFTSLFCGFFASMTMSWFDDFQESQKDIKKSLEQISEKLNTLCGAQSDSEQTDCDNEQT